MGAFSPLPDLPDDRADDILERFHRPILVELARRGSPFRGALYAGLILTADGPVLLECNARFGDPEAQVILPRLAVALGPLLLAAARGDLVRSAKPLGLSGLRLPTTRAASVGVVLAAAGYPGRPRGGDAIHGLEAAGASGALVFHAGTVATSDGYATSGGRVVTVVERGPDLPAAARAAAAAAASVTFPGAQWRRDIGLRPLVDAGAGAGAGAAVR